MSRYVVFCFSEVSDCFFKKNRKFPSSLTFLSPVTSRKTCNCNYTEEDNTEEDNTS